MRVSMARAHGGAGEERHPGDHDAQAAMGTESLFRPLLMVRRCRHQQRAPGNVETDNTGLLLSFASASAGPSMRHRVSP
jgi:hypothetical protein